MGNLRLLRRLGSPRPLMHTCTLFDLRTYVLFHFRRPLCFTYVRTYVLFHFRAHWVAVRPALVSFMCARTYARTTCCFTWIGSSCGPLTAVGPGGQIYITSPGSSCSEAAAAGRPCRAHPNSLCSNSPWAWQGGKVLRFWPDWLFDIGPGPFGPPVHSHRANENAQGQ